MPRPIQRSLPYLGALLLASLVFPAAASAQTARVTTTLAMRAGPSTQFPAVTTVHSGEDVVIHGCVRGYSWCDVSADGDRGWIYAAYLTYPYNDNYVSILDYGDEIDLPILVFSVDNYWGHYYRGRPWYHNRGHWRSVWREQPRGRGEVRDRDRRSVNRQTETRQRIEREDRRGRDRSASGQREERRGRAESRSRTGGESTSRNLGRGYEGRSMGAPGGAMGRSGGGGFQDRGDRGGDGGGRHR